MPSYKFGDEEAKVWELLPQGDYVAEVIKCEFGLQTGSGVTRGSENMELSLAIDGRNATVRETLIFHEKTLWKIDTFVKSFNLLVDGRAPVKGVPIEFTEPMVVGLRGHVSLKIEDYKKVDGTPAKSNKVAVFITNKERLTKVVDIGDAAPSESAPVESADDPWCF